MSILDEEDQDYKLWIMFLQTEMATLRAREKELAKCGISRAESFILFVIKAMGDQATPAEISRIVLRQPHTVSELLSRMERRGWVSKSRSQKNKSMVNLKLTKQGHALYRKTMKRESIHKIFADLSEEDRERFSYYLEHIRARALDLIGVKRTAFFPSLEEL